MTAALDIPPGTLAVVVNDDPVQLRTVSALLQKGGIETREFTSAESAITTMNPAAPPSIVITDLHMPDIDGWHFCRLLRSAEYPAFNRVPILVISALFSGEEPDRIATDIGADGFLAVPVEGAELLARVSAILRGEPSERPLRVLVVEDSPIWTALLRETFTAHNYLIETASDVKEALRTLHHLSVDIAIIDYHLPDGNGEAVLSWLQQERRNCICILMTTDPSPELALNWMKRGAAAYLRKPFEPEYLIEICHRTRRERTLLRSRELLDIRSRELKDLFIRYQAIFHDSPDSIVVHDETGVILDANHAAAKRFGQTPSSLIGRSLSDFLFQDVADRLPNNARITLDGTAQVFETRYRTADNRIRFGEVHERSIPWGTGRAVLSITRDITDRKLAESAMEHRMMTLVQPRTEPADIHIADLIPLETLQHLQDEFARVTGVGSVLTTPNGQLITNPSHHSRLCRDIIRCTEEGQTNCAASRDLSNTELSTGPNIRICPTGVLWEAGAPIHVDGRHIANWIIGQVRTENGTEADIRNYATHIGADPEAAAQAFHEIPILPETQFGDIVNLVSTLTTQLSTLAYQNIQQARFIHEREEAAREREELEMQLIQSQKMECVGRLAGGVAHDFNNMLSVILSNTELALENLEPDSPIIDDLTEIRRAARHSSDLTRQLLAFARKQVIRPITLELNRTIESILRILRRLLGEHIRIEFRPAPNLWKIHMDPAQIDQVITNLCINARDAIETSGTITIETANRIVGRYFCRHHAHLSPGEYVQLRIKDDGCGMNDEILNCLFEPFFTTKSVGSGTGLGLSTVLGIVNQNDGHIHVSSKPNLGSTFEVFLPRHNRISTLPPPPETAVPQQQADQRTILLVEDEPAILKVVTRMLRRMNMNVLSASSAESALQMDELYPGTIDILMTDVIMPDMNGRDLARQMQSRRPGLHCLFMSGYTSDVISSQTQLPDDIHFLQKPFTTGELSKLLNQILVLPPSITGNTSTSDLRRQR